MDAAKIADKLRALGGVARAGQLGVSRSALARAVDRITHRDAGAAAFGVVSIVQALVQLAACLGAESFFAAFESAWRLGVIDRADREQVRRRLPARFRWLVDLARPDADSGLESLLRLRLRLLGIALSARFSSAASVWSISWSTGD